MSNKKKSAVDYKKILLAATIAAMVSPQDTSTLAYSTLIEAISDTSTPDKTYTLTGSETTTAVLGTLKGSSLIIDGSANKYGITDGTGNSSAYLKIGSGQSLTVKNIGTYTTTTSSDIIDGIDAIVGVTVGESWNGFGVNTSGQGAIYSDSGNITITDSAFSNNSGQWGGALYNKGTLSIAKSVFANNVNTNTGGDRGGSALFNEGSVTSISDSIFYENVGYQGGSLHNKKGSSIGTIEKSWFVSNKPDGDWGNYSSQGDALWNDGNITTIDESYFINLRANSGGAIYNQSNGIIDYIQNSYFANIITSTHGAAIYNVGRIENIIGSKFLNNYTNRENSHGGAIYNSGTITKIDNSYFEGNSVTKTGGAILNTGTISIISNSNFLNNSAPKGSGVIDTSGTIDEINNIVIENPSDSISTNGIYVSGNGVINNIIDTTIKNLAGVDSSGVSASLGKNVAASIGTIDNLTLQNINSNGICVNAAAQNSSFTIDKITNSTIENNGSSAIYLRGQTTVDELSHTTFTNNNADSKSLYGSSIYMDNATINTIDDVDIYGGKARNGGAIINKSGHIGIIKDLTITNSAALDEAKNLQNIIANETGATIGTVTNLSIIGGNGVGLSFWGATADTVQQSVITGTTGYGINVSGRNATSDSYITTLDDVTISNNERGGIFIEPDSTGTYTSKIDLIKNSAIINNGYIGGYDYAGGIWASTDTLTILADGADGITTFKDNLRRGVSTGIWMDKQNSTLNLQQTNSGKMYMYDNITGTNSRYYVDISGDKTGTLYLYGDIDKGMTDIQDTNIDTADGIIHEHNFATLSSDADSRYVVDIDFNTTTPASSTADTFKPLNASLTPEDGVTKSTSGLITLSSLNFINDVSKITKGQETSVQIIKSPTGNLQLAEDFKREGDFSVFFVLQDDIKTDIDDVKPVTKWDDDIAIYSVNTKVLGNAEIRTTDTTNDTLYMKIESALQNKTKIGSLDTLMAVNQANLYNRSFETTKENDTYTVKSDLGETNGGNITIKGADAVNHSVIDFNETNHYKGFELDGPTNLTIKNVEIKNSSALITGTSYSANTYIYDSYLHHNGSGIETDGKLYIGSKTQIDDNITLSGDYSTLDILDTIDEVSTPADVTFNGVLTGTPSTVFTFDTGKVTLGSAATINNTNLTLDNTILNVGKNDAFNSVNLIAGNSTLNLQNESTGNQTFSTLTLNGDMSFGIDLDLENALSDGIIVEGDFTPNDHNIVINSVYLLNDSLTSAVDIVLTEDDRFEGVYTLSGDLASHIAKAATVTGSYNLSYSDFGSIAGKDADKGIIVIDKIVGNSLAIQVASDDSIKLYGLAADELVETDLGLLHGISLAVTGNNTYLINGQNHAGITLGTGATEQTLSINGVTSYKNFDTAIINGAKGTLEIENVLFEDNSVADIDNGGTMLLSGTNVFDSIVDTLGSGSTTITGGTTTINTGLTQNTLTITAGTLTNNATISAHNVNVTGALNDGTLTLTDSGTLTVNS
ncbi:MAG: hypothetical protein K6A44_05945, partial [bacterium]|nr:hypothetical protein [bacterium]